MSSKASCWAAAESRAEEKSHYASRVRCQMWPTEKEKTESEGAKEEKWEAGRELKTAQKEGEQFSLRDGKSLRLRSVAEVFYFVRLMTGIIHSAGGIHTLSLLLPLARTKWQRRAMKRSSPRKKSFVLKMYCNIFFLYWNVPAQRNLSLYSR